MRSSINLWKTIEGSEIMEQSIPEIYIVAPTKVMYDRALAIIQERGENIGVIMGAFEVIDTCRQLAEQGVKIFVTRGGLRKALRKELPRCSVVEMPILLSDYVPMFQSVRKVKGKVGMFHYENTPQELSTMCDLLHLEVNYYIFDQKNSEEIFQQALKDGIKVSAGGATIEPLAEKYGIAHYTIENNLESYSQAIESAKDVLEVQKAEEAKRHELNVKLKRFQAIFNYSHDGIIATDKDEQIEMLNQNAASLLHLDAEREKGNILCSASPPFCVFSPQKQSLHEIDHMIQVNREWININKIPIIEKGQYSGSIYTFFNVKDYQHKEREMRIKLHEKGLTAKYHFCDILGKSKKINMAKALAKSYAVSDYTVLIVGETGTGKELFAQSIHNAGRRKDGPFVAINCASLSDSLLEAELFGYSKGSFTGGLKEGKQGLFELAHGGTIFLDEIGEIPLSTQTQLLRVIEEREIRRIGGDRLIPVDIRIIAATNKNLEEQIKRGLFREDLYYRLNVLNLEVPALRERKKDIPVILEALLKKMNLTDNPSVLELFRGLEHYSWPGNVRELRSFVERLYVICNMIPQNQMQSDLIKEFLLQDKTKGGGLYSEAEKILQTLEKNEYNLEVTARELKMSRTTLWRKRKKYNL